MKSRISRVLIPAAVFATISITHILSPVTTSGDSRWAVPIVISILTEGNIDVNEYVSLKEKWPDYCLIKVGDREYSFFPWQTYLFAIPDVCLRLLFQDRDQIIGDRATIEKSTASLVVALAAVFVFLIARRSLDTGFSLFLVFIFAYCTPVWSTASRALWQHGPSVLALTIALYFVLRADELGRGFVFVGLAVALSYVLRPTNIVTVATFAAYIMIFRSRHFPSFFLGTALVLVCFVASNWFLYDSVLPPYYASGRIHVHDNFGEALLGNLISPSRGLIAYSPIVVGSIWGSCLRFRQRPPRRLDYFLASTVVIHWIVISSYSHWWAGHSFGPRFFTDVVPYFIYFLVPVMERITRLKGMKKLTLVCLLFILTAWSFFVHFRGATDWRTLEWNRIPNDVDKVTSRLWDWKDPQFLRGFLGPR